MKDPRKWMEIENITDTHTQQQRKQKRKAKEDGLKVQQAEKAEG